PVRAQQQDDSTAPPADWEQTTLSEEVLQLFTPTSGPLYARTRSGLSRSDDAGTTWRAVSLPPGPVGSVAVDPSDHTTIYAAEQDGLYKTVDDAHSWRLISPASTTVKLTSDCLRVGQDYLSFSCEPAGSSEVTAWPI